MLFYVFKLDSRCLCSFYGLIVVLLLSYELLFDLLEVLLAGFFLFFRLWFVLLELLSFELSNFLLQGYKVSLLLFKILLSFPCLLLNFSQFVFEIFYLSLIISHLLFQVNVIQILLHYQILYELPFYCNFFTFFILLSCYCTQLISWSMQVIMFYALRNLC